DERSKVRYVFVDGLKFEYNKGAEPVPAGTPATTPASLAGLWQIDIDAADGKVPATLELTQNGNSLAGSFRSQQGDGKVSSGKIEGTKFDLIVAIGAGAQTIELKFSGAADMAADG